MCGIAGFVGKGSQADLEAMTRALAHRGPDGHGYFHDPVSATFLGHRRLAVIDLAGGQQPLWNEDRTVGIVFNGEIYNHHELRTELVARGHRFHTHHSDTEVLVHGFEEWGEGLLQRLNGMFAFAIFDRTRQRLFLARDRFGEKPLYYFWRPGLLAFASELHALPMHGAIPAEPDVTAIQKYFAYGFFPAPHSFYRGCRKLPGGCYFSIDCAAPSEPQIKRYWRFQIEPDDSLLVRNEKDVVEELRFLLRNSVERRLISDVPLGLFLSGGIDSSLIAALVTQLRDPPSVRTFTIGFTDASFDESPFAGIVAETLGTDHRAELLDQNAISHLVPEVLARMDEPLGDPSIIPTYLLCRSTRRSVTVALSGDGGDELFAGYDPFAALGPASLYCRLVPHVLHRGIRRLADLLPTSNRNMAFDFKVKRALRGLSYPEAMRNPIWMGPLEPDAFKEIFQAPLSAEELFSEAITGWSRDGSLHPVDRTLEYFTNFYLQDDILTKVDRASMMNSLEARSVFLDNDLVAFCQRLPHQLKYRNGERKYLLKKAAQGLLPDSIVSRRKKGFGMPVARWLRSAESSQTAELPGMRLGATDRFWAEHRAGSHDHRLLLWALLSLDFPLAKPPPSRRPGSAVPADAQLLQGAV
jgi:asparagine synthase (glutamine-hydrolysing)